MPLTHIGRRGRVTQRESAAEGRERTTTRSARQPSMQTASVQSQLALRTHVHISHRVVSQNRKRPFQHTCGAVQAPLQTCAVQCIEYMRRRESDRAVACVGSTRGSSDSPTVLYVRARPFRHAALRPHPTHPPKGWPLRRREGLSRRSDPYSTLYIDPTCVFVVLNVKNEDTYDT